MMIEPATELRVRVSLRPLTMTKTPGGIRVLRKLSEYVGLQTSREVSHEWQA